MMNSLLGIKNYSSLEKCVFSFLVVVAGLLFCNFGFATAVSTLSGLTTNMNSTFSLTAIMMEDVSIFAGWVFVLVGIFKCYSVHKPGGAGAQIGAIGWVMPLIIGVALISWPYILQMFVASLTGAGTKLGTTDITSLIGS